MTTIRTRKNKPSLRHLDFYAKVLMRTTRPMTARECVLDRAASAYTGEGLLLRHDYDPAQGGFVGFDVFDPDTQDLLATVCAAGVVPNGAK